MKIAGPRGGLGPGRRESEAREVGRRTRENREPEHRGAHRDDAVGMRCDVLALVERAR
jgi:hypothetical protein